MREYDYVHDLHVLLLPHSHSVDSRRYVESDVGYAGYAGYVIMHYDSVAAVPNAVVENAAAMHDLSVDS